MQYRLSKQTRSQNCFKLCEFYLKRQHQSLIKQTDSILVVSKWHILILYFRWCCTQSRQSNLTRTSHAYFFVPGQADKQAFEMRVCSKTVFLIIIIIISLFWEDDILINTITYLTCGPLWIYNEIKLWTICIQNIYRQYETWHVKHNV